jgi:hypothetical protein
MSCRGDLVPGVTFCTPQTPRTAEGRHWSFPAKQFLVLPLCCLMNFCKMKIFQLILLSKFFLRLCMFLLFLCLGTILAPSCPASCHQSSSPPPSSGSVVTAWSPLSSRSTRAPTLFCAMAPAPSPSESGHETRSSPSATSRPARQWTPSLEARVAAADHQVHVQVALPQPSGSRF